MRFGLSESEIDIIRNCLNKYPEIKSAKIFGSRAKGNYKNGSDVDISLHGENVTLDTVTSVNSLLNEDSPLIYFFDVLNYTDIENKDLKEHIDRAGIEIYTMTTPSKINMQTV